MFLFYILFFSFIAVLPAHCYIDPGTGSMLFSVLIGFVSIFFFAAKTALIKIKTCIIAIAERGQNDLVMDAAREGGARGGTVLRGRGTAGTGSQTFFGVSIAEEKELVLIVSDTESKRDIMRAIMQKAGADTPARAVVFSLPVTEACGFRYGK